jgi:site-specific DNA recombinase
MERLRDAVAAGQVECVYVLAPDRLARRYAHHVLVMEEFRHAGVEIEFLNSPISGTAEDDLLLQIQGVVAEYERTRILERSRRSRRHAARFAIVPEEARMVGLIFAWVGLERLSLR